METTIFYYTGTGNSLWTARMLAARLGSSVPVSITGFRGTLDAGGERALGLVFPVYIWGVPAPVIRFVDSHCMPRDAYIFAIAVNAGQVSNTLVQLERILKHQGVRLAAGFGIKMPSNYIPWGGPGPEETRRRLFKQAEEKIAGIASAISRRQPLPVEKGPLWQRILFTAMYRMSFNKVPEMDKGFWVDDKCDRCGICAQICPAENITLKGDGPLWNHRCHQCFACLQWCPKEAVQYGRKTPAYERYHHPDIRLKDMLNDPAR